MDTIDDQNPGYNTDLEDDQEVVVALADNVPTPAEYAALLQRMNQRYAVVSRNGRTFVLDERDLTYLTFEDFKKLRNRNKLPVAETQTGARGKQTKTSSMPVGSWWLNHSDRRQYDRVVFDPSGSPVPDDTYNLWRGFAVEPRSGACHGFINHLLQNICQGDKRLTTWVVAWLAQLVQQPATKLGTALVLRGGKGTGKGFFVNAVGKLLGRHYVYVTQQRHLTGHFNAPL